MRRFTFWPCGLFPARVGASRPQHLLAVAITAFSLAGCTAPRGFLEPVAKAASPATSQVEMLVATTRARTKPAEMFSGQRERGKALHFADIVVSIPPVHQPGKVEYPHQIPGDPATDFVTLQPPHAIREQQEAVAVLRRLVRNTPKKDVLVFVHGYNTRFEDAVFTFAQFVHDSEAKVVPVLFTWPSKGKWYAYGYDHESANYSRDALEGGLRVLAKDPEVGEISILAHSMGNWVTLEALRQMAIRDGKVAGKIRNVVLAAPDVDPQVVFKQIDQIDALGARRPKFTLVTSEDDGALGLSRKVWGERRLGSIDPDQEPYRSDLKSKGIQVVNATTVPSSGLFHHGKFHENPELARLIRRTLTPGQTLTESRVSPGERLTRATAGLTASVGQAAGLVVSTPLAIVDPDTREQYGDQIDALTQSVQDAATLQ